LVPVPVAVVISMTMLVGSSALHANRGETRVARAREILANDVCIGSLGQSQQSPQRRDSGQDLGVQTKGSSRLRQPGRARRFM
jgi:hypothetical protein